METNTTKKELIKEYLRELLCRMHFHTFDGWENYSRFVSPAYNKCGWIARLRKTCVYCGRYKETEPFLKRDRDQLIEEVK